MHGVHQFLKLVLWDAANLVVFVFVLVRYGRAPFRALLDERAREASREIREGQERKSRADARLSEVRRRLEGLSQEAAALMRDGRTEGAIEARKIREAAEARAQLMLREADDVAAEEERLARAGLRREMVGEALRQARAILQTRVGPEEEARFSEALVASAARGGRP